MKKKIFLVYEYSEGFAIPYSALAFVEDNNPDGFGLVSSHQSSSLDWAKFDIVNKGHSEIFDILPTLKLLGFWVQTTPPSM